MKKAFIVVVLLGLGITVYTYLGFRTTEFVPEVSTVTLNRGDVVDTVGATGALEAVTTVQVGSQVSGIIEALYADFNSIVNEGDVIARLEPSLFETQVEQARANLARSEADVERPPGDPRGRSGTAGAVGGPGVAGPDLRDGARDGAGGGAVGRGAAQVGAGRRDPIPASLNRTRSTWATP